MNKTSYNYFLKNNQLFNSEENQMCNKTVPPIISASEIQRVKGLGFLRDKQTPDCFNARVITKNGKITADEMMTISEAAQKFGSGEITMTVRMTLEIQRIPYDNIEPLRAFLEKSNLQIGGTGAKIRSVVSCKGTTCQYGLCDTFAISQELYDRFFCAYNDVKLPHKFKLAVGGCPNNCVKPNLNDVGIIGQKRPILDQEKCRNCKKCSLETVCPMDAMHVVDGVIQVEKAQCVNCGLCFKKCPFDVVTKADVGYRMYIGGRWGKKITIAKSLDKMFVSLDEVYSIVEKIILLYREQGWQRERFSDTVDRLGFNYVQEQLYGNALLERKEKILQSDDYPRVRPT